MQLSRHEMQRSGSRGSQISRDESQLPWHREPRGKVLEGKGLSPVQARCTLDSRLLVDAGEGGCSLPVASLVSPSPLSSRAPLGGIIVAVGIVLGFWGEPQARWTSCLLSQCWVPGMSIAPGSGSVRPGASPGQVLPTSQASAPPHAAPAATSLKIAHL